MPQLLGVKVPPPPRHPKKKKKKWRPLWVIERISSLLTFLKLLSNNLVQFGKLVCRQSVCCFRCKSCLTHLWDTFRSWLSLQLLCLDYLSDTVCLPSVKPFVNKLTHNMLLLVFIFLSECQFKALFTRHVFKYVDKKKQWISRCCTRGEPEESSAQRWRKHASKGSILFLKPRADITRSDTRCSTKRTYVLRKKTKLNKNAFQ